MRCSLGKKKIARLRQQTGLDVLAGSVRGGTDHRIDLYLSDGSVMELHKDGRMEKAPIAWNMKGWLERQNEHVNE